VPLNLGRSDGSLTASVRVGTTSSTVVRMIVDRMIKQRR